MRDSHNPVVEVLLDTTDVSLLFGCSPSTVIRLAEEGHLAHVAIRHKRKTTRKFKPSAIQAFIAGNTIVSTFLGRNILPPPLPLLDDSTVEDFSPEHLASLPPPPRNIESVLSDSSHSEAAVENAVASPLTEQPSIADESPEPEVTSTIEASASVIEQAAQVDSQQAVT